MPKEKSWAISLLKIWGEWSFSTKICWNP